MMEKLGRCGQDAQTPAKAVARCAAAVLSEFRKCRNTPAQAMNEVKAQFDGLAVAGRNIGEVQAVELGIAVVGSVVSGGATLVQYLLEELMDQISEVKANLRQDPVASCQLGALTVDLLRGFATDMAGGRVPELKLNNYDLVGQLKTLGDCQ